MAKDPVWKAKAKKRINEYKQEIDLIETLLAIIEERGQIIDNLAREVEELKKPRLI